MTPLTRWLIDVLYPPPEKRAASQQANWSGRAGINSGAKAQSPNPQASRPGALSDSLVSGMRHNSAAVTAQAARPGLMSDSLVSNLRRNQAAAPPTTMPKLFSPPAMGQLGGGAGLAALQQYHQHFNLGGVVGQREQSQLASRLGQMAGSGGGSSPGYGMGDFFRSLGQFAGGQGPAQQPQQPAAAPEPAAPQGPGEGSGLNAEDSFMAELAKDTVRSRVDPRMAVPSMITGSLSARAAPYLAKIPGVGRALGPLAGRVVPALAGRVNPTSLAWLGGANLLAAPIDATIGLPQFLGGKGIGNPSGLENFSPRQYDDRISRLGYMDRMGETFNAKNFYNNVGATFNATSPLTVGSRRNLYNQLYHTGQSAWQNRGTLAERSNRQYQAAPSQIDQARLERPDLWYRDQATGKVVPTRKWLSDTSPQGLQQRERIFGQLGLSPQWQPAQ